MGRPMSTRARITVHGENPPLALEFHPRGNAVYVRLSSEMVVRTVEVEEGALADYDERGALVGFELVGLEDPQLGHVLDRLRKQFAADAPQLQSVEAITA